MRPFAAIFVPAELAKAVSDRAWLDAMLDAERALANASSLAGAIPAAAAAAVAEACRSELYDVETLAEQGRAPGNPVEPLVRALREQIGGEEARYAHRGATSQDILDTAAMLVAQRALRLIDEELTAVADATAELAQRYRDAPMAARTLLQQAVPTTFGFKAASWLVGVLSGRRRLRALAAELPAQLGGAAGTLAALGESGPEVARHFAAELGLREPVLPWHTNRAVVAELGSALAIASGSLAKSAADIVLLAQSEVAEVAEAEGGASSTMPQKRNPVGAVLTDACARAVRGYASVLVESVPQEHERAAGAWHAEWHALAGALAATGGAAAALRRSLAGLQVDPERMRTNIGAGVLAEQQSLGLGENLDPAGYLGSAGVFVDRALALYAEEAL